MTARRKLEIDGNTFHFTELVHVNENGVLVASAKRTALLTKKQMKNKALIKMFEDAGWKVIPDEIWKIQL